MPKPIPSHDEVRSAFDDGSIINASKEDLERFLIANGQQRILHQANQSRASEMGETMRQLLAARQSQEMHSEALRISKVALLVSVVALVAGLLGAGASYWPLLNPKPTEVYSLQTNPVHVRSAETPRPQTTQVESKSPQVKSESPRGEYAKDHAKN